jgi:hypothetical protein
MPTEPIVAETTVPVPPTHAFTGFTAQMGEWWDPLLTPDPPTFTSIEIDPEGEVAMVHGSDRHVWGRVTTWEPGSAYAQDFWLGPDGDVDGGTEAAPTTLRVTFTEAEGGTRVRLEHGGWTSDTGELRARYSHWDELVQRYAAHVT